MILVLLDTLSATWLLCLLNASDVMCLGGLLKSLGIVPEVAVSPDEFSARFWLGVCPG